MTPMESKQIATSHANSATDLAKSLFHLRNDYEAQTGSPFAHFYCPLLFKDEPAILCMGHVVPESFPDSCGARIAQRADVDSFYGSIAEADFGTLLEARKRGSKNMVTDNASLKRFRPKLVADGEEVRYYAYSGSKKPEHSLALLETQPGGEEIQLVLAKSHDEIASNLDKDWRLVVERDSRLTGIVTLIKAAYLTLFRVHGYRWSLSAAGASVGYDILGRFFRENHGRNQADIRTAMKAFFLPYKHMVRPVVAGRSENPMRGTLEDHRAGVCFGSSGRPFALVVYVRTGAKLHAVLMPAFRHPDSVEAYLNFLKRDYQETLRVSLTRYDTSKQHWEVSPEPIEAHWPKQGDSFEFD